MFYWCISLQTKHGRCWGTCALDSTGWNMSESQRMTSLSHETFLLKVSTVLCWSGLISFNLYPPGWHLTAAFSQNLLMWRKTEIYNVEDLKNFQRSHSLSFFFSFLIMEKMLAASFLDDMTFVKITKCWRKRCWCHRQLMLSCLIGLSVCLNVWNHEIFISCSYVLMRKQLFVFSFFHRLW